MTGRQESPAGPAGASSGVGHPDEASLQMARIARSVGSRAFRGFVPFDKKAGLATRSPAGGTGSAVMSETLKIPELHDPLLRGGSEG